MRSRPVAFILAVGGAHSGSAWITERAARLGFRPIVISKGIPFRELGYAAGWIKLDAENAPDEIAAAGAKMDAKLVLSDHRNYLLPTAAHVQGVLGLRGLGDDGPRTSNDKFAFRQALDDAGAPTLEWSKLGQADAPPPEMPFIAKPTKGTGSRGVKKVSTQADFEELVAEMAADTEDRGWIAEEYIPARQFDVEGIVRDGVCYPLSITEEHYEETDGHFPSAWFLFSPPIPRAWGEKLKETAAKTLTACGVKNGAFHVEIRLTEDMRAVPIDYSNRYGYPMMVSAASGVDFIEYYARTLIDAAFKPPKPAQNSVYQVYCSNAKQRARAMRLIAENENDVIEARMLGSVVGGVQTFGRLSLKTKTFAEMENLLGRYDLRPQIWDTLYHGSAHRDV